MNLTKYEYLCEHFQKYQEGMLDPGRCYPWPWAIDPQGYPVYRYAGWLYRAPATIVKWKNGLLQADRLPKGYYAVRIIECKSRSCINPQHLYKGTRKDLARVHLMQNQGYGTGKLTAKEVLEIRKILKKGKHTDLEIAEMYGISRSTITNIKNRVIWKNLCSGDFE